jgi:hypothetical protein
MAMLTISHRESIDILKPCTLQESRFICWNYMCPATIFKVIWNCLIFGIPHYGIYTHVFVHGISLRVYYGIIAC